MGTAYEYHSKLRVMEAVFHRTGPPRSMVAAGLPEKHGYDLDWILLAQRQGRESRDRCSLLLCDDRPQVLAGLERALARLPDPGMRERVELEHLESLLDWHKIVGRRFDWAVNTASLQRLTDDDIVIYMQRARQVARYAFLFFPNGDNRAHLTLSGLRGLSIERVLTLCRQALDPWPSDEIGQEQEYILSAGFCDIPPFPPGLQRSEKAKRQAMHSPVEAVAMWGLEWWCRGESLLPLFLQRRFAHLVYVALDLGEDEA
jgi:hypothetical protein